MIYTLVSFIIHVSVLEKSPKINTTFTFKTLALCEKAIDDVLTFYNEQKDNSILITKFLIHPKDDSRILKIEYTDKKLIKYSKCVKSEIAFNKEIFKKNQNELE